jgi:small subunit ribosomal protein S20
MANTSSARKAARVIARRTDVNTARRSRMRTSVRKVEEAIASGDKTAALAALKAIATPRTARSRVWRMRPPSSASNPAR